MRLTEGFKYSNRSGEDYNGSANQPVFKFVFFIRFIIFFYKQK